MKWYHYLISIIVLCSLVVVGELGYSERDEEIAKLKKNSVSEAIECVNGVLYTTYSFKDLVIYEPQYVHCNK